MCGVVGYVGNRHCRDILFQGLKQLEYRGYDSAGIAVLDENGQVAMVKTEGKLKELEPLVEQLPKKATLGMGHTRWATHGPPITQNAHPHVRDNTGIVHNGIIENYADLKAGLVAGGVRFSSETDTEVVLHLLNEELRQNETTQEAIISLAKKLKGAFSLGIIVPSEPEALYVVKQGSPVAIGLGDGENFFGSDASALVAHTKNAVFMEDGQFARITPNQVKVYDFEGEELAWEAKELDWNSDSVEKQGHAHYMIKEIHEQPTVLRKMIARLIDPKSSEINLAALGLKEIDLDRVESINIVACGTAYYSGVIGKYAIESIAKIPVNVELASEFRYRRPMVNENSLTIAVTQSGETMDTLESIKYAKSQGSQIFCICNVPYSSITREAEGTLLMECGPEIGVASTKAFTAMVLSQIILAYGLAEGRAVAKFCDNPTLGEDLKNLPILLEQVIGRKEELRKLAESYYEYSHFLFIGRGEHYAIAMEGALKLKEISYIHAEAYAAGELKHGPIALIDEHMPVLVVAPDDEYYEKVVSNMEQIVARKGRVLMVTNKADRSCDDICDHVFYAAGVKDKTLQSIASVVPLQIFSYYVALLRGTDVDQPRNLAKSVTVE